MFRVFEEGTRFQSTKTSSSIMVGRLEEGKKGRKPKLPRILENDYILKY